jgi:hypothetical protein
MYDHIARDPEHHGHVRLCKLGQSFSDFIRDPYFRPLVANYHARFLAFRPTRQQLEWVGPALPGQIHPKQTAMDLHPIDVTDNELHARAHATLEASDVVGCAERFPETCQLVCRRLGWLSRDATPHLNRGSKRLTAEDLSSADRDMLRAWNEVDYDLHGYALRRVGSEYRGLLSEPLQSSAGPGAPP